MLLIVIESAHQQYLTTAMPPSNTPRKNYMAGSPYLIASDHLVPVVGLIFIWWENRLLHLHGHHRLRALRVPEWNYFFRIHIINDTTHREGVLPA